jgi:acyl carrier protein
MAESIPASVGWVKIQVSGGSRPSNLRDYTAAVPDREQIASSIREVLLSSWPSRFSPDQLRDDAALGESGLGLDSVEIVEVVLACEERCGVHADENLFEPARMTIGGITDHLAGAIA